VDELITTGTTDELVVTARTPISRRNMLKRLGAGGLAVASAAALNPLGAAAADYGWWWPDLPWLNIKRSVRDAVITVGAYPWLSDTAFAEIKNGTYRYGITYRLRSRRETVRQWTLEPLPATTKVDGDTTFRMGYSELLSYGSTFQVTFQLYKKRRGSNTKIVVGKTWSTLWVTIKPAHGTVD
jgi:hypothetical protein